MNLVKAPYMRRLLVVVLPVVLVASFIGLSTGCATEDPHEPLLLRIDAPRRRRAPEDPPSQELAAERIEVRGSIATDLEGGAVRREVTLVDAGGQRHDAVTDDLGKFVVRGVSAPYDVTVVPRSGGPSAVFLGVRRADPHLELVERSAPVVPTASQLLRVGVHLGDTPCSTSPGWVTVVTTSASRAGSTLARCRAGEDTIVLDVEHDGQREGAAAEDRVDVHVLVEDEDASSFAYGRLEDVSIADGIIANVGDVAPLPIGMTSPFTIGAHRGTSSLADWQWTTAVFIDVSGDARSPAFLFGMAPTASMRLALPLIPGATMRVSVFGRHPRNDRRGTFFRSTEAWSDVQIPSGTDVELDVGAGPELVRPTEGGTLSQRGLGFEWTDVSATANGVEGTPSVPVLAMLSFADGPTGAVVLRVSTMDHALPLERLGALGVAKIDVGEHWLDLSATTGVGIDDVVSPDAIVRRRPFDRTRAGAATFLRVPFRVAE